MKSILYILTLTLIFCSCNKNEISKMAFTTINISQKSDQFKFKKGSYWIFRNDSTGVEDSITIEEVSEGLIITNPAQHGSGGIQNEFFSMTLLNHSTGEKYQDYLMENYIRRSSAGFPFSWPAIFLSDGVVGQKSGNIEIVSKSPSMILNNITFNNTWTVRIIAPVGTDSFFAEGTILIFSENIGLIKIVTDTGSEPIESSGVVRYKIVY